MTSESLFLADTHCHLMLPAFKKDRMKALARAEAASVIKILVPGIDLQTSRMAVSMAEKHASVYAAIGLHPHRASSWKEGFASELRNLASSSSVVAIGEIGLDYYRNLSPPSTQRQVFRQLLELATELKLPVVVHSRQATAHVLEDLLAWSTGLPPALSGRAGVLHAFSGDAETATKAVAGGFYLGVAGPVTYPDAGKHRDLVAKLPLERIVIETDAPYMTPHPHRGKRNEPAYVRFVARALSQLFEKDLPGIARTTSRSAANLFGWDNEADDRTIH
jgi:TatD DNase family protein